MDLRIREKQKYVSLIQLHEYDLLPNKIEFKRKTGQNIQLNIYKKVLLICLTEKEADTKKHQELLCVDLEYPNNYNQDQLEEVIENFISLCKKQELNFISIKSNEARRQNDLEFWLKLGFEYKKDKLINYLK